MNCIGALLECCRSCVQIPDRVKPKPMKLVFVVSPLSTQHQGERQKAGWLGIMIMCQNGGHV